MKHFYLFSKTLLIAAALLGSGELRAQNETSAVPGNCPNVTQDFTNGTGGFTSPSIYGNITFDSAFYYNNARGIWTEIGSILPGRQFFPAPNRVVTIVSPPYASSNTVAGMYDVGFYYIVPNVATARFNVSLIRLTTVPGPGGDITYQESVARSGFKFFSDFTASGPTPYVDPIPGNIAWHSGQQGVACIRLIDQDITVGSNVTYRVEFTYIIPEPIYSDFDNFAIGSTAPGPLPVNFMGLVASRVNNSINVKWDVVDEVDVREYQLEKSTNGATFSTVGIVNAQGKTVYSYTDHNGKASVMYYRVKSVDIDGKTKYSGIVKITGNASYADDLKVYPSPANAQITLSHKKLNTNAIVTVTGADGRILRTMRPAAGASNTMMDVSALVPGMYVVRVDNGNGQIETTTFVKQ